MPVDWTLLTQVNNAHEANLMQALLETENILVSIGDEHMNRLVPAYSPILGWVKIFVPAQDLARAQAVIAENHSTDGGQISEAELTQAALASSSPEDLHKASHDFATLERSGKPLQYEGPSWLVWIILGFILSLAMWYSA